MDMDTKMKRANFIKTSTDIKDMFNFALLDQDKWRLSFLMDLVKQKYDIKACDENTIPENSILDVEDFATLLMRTTLCMFWK